MKWGEPIIMALKKCPKCGMDNILRQDSCQYCRFNMHSYVNNLLHETASMTPEERKQKIYAQILKPPLQSSQPKCIQISGNLSKVIKKQQSV